MKCYPFEEKRLAKWHPPYIVQPKYDGVRCRAIPLQTSMDQGFMLLSSEENIIFGVPHINIALQRLGIRAELDGELYTHGLPFEEIVSVTSRQVNIHPDHQKIQYHIFDIINSEPQMRRTLIIENLHNLNPWIKVAPFYLCESLDEVTKAYDSIVNMGYEGIIVRHVAAPYERKRSTYVMKFKPKKEDVYEIVRFEEEFTVDGMSKDSLGALVCKSGDGHLFNVGTGFTRDQRNEFWKTRDELVGNFARVKYQHITSGRNVPRFPVFVDIINKEVNYGKV